MEQKMQARASLALMADVFLQCQSIKDIKSIKQINQMMIFNMWYIRLIMNLGICSIKSRIYSPYLGKTFTHLRQYLPNTKCKFTC